MCHSIIKTVELLHLNEAAKALKQKNFIITLNNDTTIIFGIDNIDSCIKFTKLDNNLFYNLALKDIIINTRNLSAFIKNITIESEFEIKQKSNGILYISSIAGAELEFIYDKYIELISLNKAYSILNYCDINLPTVAEENVTDKLINLFSLHKEDGCVYYKHNDRYYITLFYGLLPLNKADKISLSIYYKDTSKTFIAKFKVIKKHFTINIYLNYLDL